MRQYRANSRLIRRRLRGLSAISPAGRASARHVTARASRQRAISASPPRHASPRSSERQRAIDIFIGAERERLANFILLRVSFQDVIFDISISFSNTPYATIALYFNFSLVPAIDFIDTALFII
jgi:hypothetical protein